MRIHSADALIMIAAAVAGSAAALQLWGHVYEHSHSSAPSADIAFWLRVGGEIAVLVAVISAAPVALRELRARKTLIVSAHEARQQMTLLFEMTDLLQSAADQKDANAVLLKAASDLLPGLGGALYVFNNSHDRLDLSVSWNWTGERLPAETLSPSQCWALKRGKAHLNELGSQALRCEHCQGDAIVLEIPMMARGEIHGLLIIEGGEVSRLRAAASIGGAIADAMSLSLANIKLREKLHTQALRDPLTGLYNRRYMDDTIDRYSSLAERSGTPFSVIMIDLDHFKKLNDEHGHSMGDSVLRDAAAAVIGAIRSSDVACRYGGEELVVLLPDCDLNDAIVQAEILRSRIQSVSDVRDVVVTASLGVASFPETTATSSNLLANADSALYEAKQLGRNRVISFPRPVNDSLPL